MFFINHVGRRFVKIVYLLCAFRSTTCFSAASHITTAISLLIVFIESLSTLSTSGMQGSTTSIVSVLRVDTNVWEQSPSHLFIRVVSDNDASSVTLWYTCSSKETDIEQGVRQQNFRHKWFFHGWYHQGTSI